jgi:hypothetical protein
MFPLWNPWMSLLFGLLAVTAHLVCLLLLLSFRVQKRERQVGFFAFFLISSRSGGSARGRYFLSQARSKEKGARL